LEDCWTNKPKFKTDGLSGKCWKEKKIRGIAHPEGGGKTKPFSAVVPIGRSAFPAQMRQTNPISDGGDTPVFPLFQYSIIPPFQSDDDYAKRTQFGPGAQKWARAGPEGPAG